MKIDNRPDEVTITLTRKEANQLRESLQTADYDPNGFNFYELSEGIKDPSVTKEEAAEAIERAVKACLQKADRHSGSTRAMYQTDAGDLQWIAQCVQRGQFEAASRATRNLDTAVRDEIPECAWPYVGLKRLR